MLRFISLAAAGLFLMHTVVSAQVRCPKNCGPRDKLLSVLADKYGEGLTGHGIASNGRAATMFYTSKKTGSFSVVVVSLSGVACIVASGRNFSGFKSPDAPRFSASVIDF